MTENKWESTVSMVSIAILPLLLIGFAVLAWVVVGIAWVITLIINIITISIGSFVIIPIEWIFLLANWILGWLGPFIGGYFTQAHFINWLNNIYLLGGLTVIGLLMDIGGVFSTSSPSESGDHHTLGTTNSSKTTMRSPMKNNQQRKRVPPKFNGEIPELEWISLAPLAQQYIHGELPGIPVPSDQIDKFENTFDEMRHAGSIKIRWHHMGKNLHSDSSGGILPDNISYVGGLPLGGAWLEVVNSDIWFSVTAAQANRMRIPHTEKFEQARIMIMGSTLHLFMLDAFAIVGKQASNLEQHDVNKVVQIALDIVSNLANQQLVFHIFGDKVEEQIKQDWLRQKQQSSNATYSIPGGLGEAVRDNLRRDTS